MYQKVANQTESLKGLWAAKLNLKGRAGMATPEDMAAYELRLSALEAELQRRKQLGGKFESTLGRMKDLMFVDERHREEHQVSTNFFNVLRQYNCKCGSATVCTQYSK